MIPLNANNLVKQVTITAFIVFIVFNLSTCFSSKLIKASQKQSIKDTVFVFFSDTLRKVPIIGNIANNNDDPIVFFDYYLNNPFDIIYKSEEDIKRRIVDINIFKKMTADSIRTFFRSNRVFAINGVIQDQKKIKCYRVDLIIWGIE